MTTVLAAPQTRITPAEITEALGHPKARLTISVRDAATILGEREDQVGTYCRTGALQATKGATRGRTSPWRITTKALAAFMNAQTAGGAR